MQSQHVIFNTLATYGRSVVALFLGVFVARWVLAALGKSDFGLYGVVGAVVCFASYLNMGLSNAVARYYAYAIGQGSRMSESQATGNLRGWFNTALGLHVAVAVVLASICYPVGHVVITHGLVVPPERLEACLWVYRFSLASVFIGVVAVPYVAMYTAFQRLVELAVLDVVRVLALFCCAYWLMTAPGDRLVAYGAVMAALPSAILLVQVVRARIVFPACRIIPRELFVMGRVRDISGFALCQMLGIGGALAKIHGSAILVNIGLGPSMNASYAVATQFSAQTSTFSGALLNALTPAISSAAGEGNRERLVHYAVSTCRFAGLLVALFAAPLICEAGALMRFWLQSPPELADALCVCFAIALFVESLSTGYVIALNASGRIARWQLTEAAILLAGLPVLWFAYSHGGGFLCVGYLFIALAAVLGLERIWFVKNLLGIPVADWLARVLFPCLLVVGVSYLVACAVRASMEESFLRILCVGISSLFVALSTAYLVVLDARERVLMRTLLARLGVPWRV